MNIFFLDMDPATSAKMACDKHIVKQTLEYAQILSTALNELGFVATYKPTHKNHPCTKWVLEDYSNFAYLWYLSFEYNSEYMHRFPANCRAHKANVTINADVSLIWEGIFEKYRDLGRASGHSSWMTSTRLTSLITAPPCVMPDQYRVCSDKETGLQTFDDLVQSYRNYYIAEKKPFAKYTNREVPNWLIAT